MYIVFALRLDIRTFVEPEPDQPVSGKFLDFIKKWDYGILPEF